MENIVGFLIESLVAVLLVATIFYCAMLDRRLKRLRNDESTMRATIAELISATHGAERAIAALRATVTDSEETLAERLGRAQALSAQMAGQLGEGEEVIGRITKIAKAARDHSQREAERQSVELVEKAREDARLQARRDAERETEARALAARLSAEQEPSSRSAATAAAAEIFANRIRALSLGAAS